QAGKGHAENDGAAEPLDKALTVAMHQRMMRPSYGSAGKEEDQRIHEWQVERIESMDTCRRPDTGFRNPYPIQDPNRCERRLKEGSEKCRKEHYFGKDEQPHPHA